MAYSLTGHSSPHDVHDGHTSLSASASQTIVNRGICNSLQWHITAFKCKQDCRLDKRQGFTIAHDCIQLQTGLEAR